MKKLISLLSLGLALVSTEATNLRTNLSFINPLVLSLGLTNDGTVSVGVTNLLYSAQCGGIWTNAPGSSQANGLGLTNYYNTTSSHTLMLMYTQSFPMVISGTNLPGVLVCVVNTNLNNSLTGVMGVPPFSASNLTYAKTNDAMNLLQDVMFPSDWTPLYGVGPGSVVGSLTNNAVGYSCAIEVQLLGNQLSGSANGSNYVTLVFSPLGSDGSEIINTSLPAFTTYGNSQSLVPFTLNITNSVNTTQTAAPLCTTIIPIPTQYIFGASGLRLRSITPGLAWPTSGILWVTRVRLILITS